MEETMIGMMLALATVAHAEQEAPLDCMGPSVSDFAPVNNQTNVPVDIAPAVLLYDDCGSGMTMSVQLEVLLREADTEVLVGSSTHEWDGQRQQRLVVQPELEPNKDYRFRVTLDNGTVPSVVDFQTGEGTVVGLESAPSITMTVAELTPLDVGYYLYVEGTVAEVDDPDDLSWIEVADAAAPDTVLDLWRAYGDEASWFSASQLLDEPLTEVCLEARQIDGLGAAVTSEPSCMPVVELEPRPTDKMMTCGTGGCSVVPGLPGASLPLILFGMITLRRREQKTA